VYDEGASEQQQRLEAAVMADPGNATFPALAELYRRSGRAADAESVVRAGLAAKPDALEGRVALALILLDRGLEREAREELQGLVEAGASLQGLALSDATGAAQAIDVARESNAAAPAAEPQADPAEISVGAPFATGTMADLLERQGDVQGAERIRASLSVRVDSADADEATSHIIEELSRWLINAQQRMGARA
jgi:hypothetical protein